MRRFLITSPKFSGTAETIYNEAGQLITLAMGDTNMTAAQVKGLKAIVPVQQADIATAYAGTTVTVVEAGFEVSFDMWWERYAKKINKARAQALWSKLSKTDQVKAWASVPGYDKYLKSTGYRSKADPETYLRQRYFENDWKNV